MLGVSHWADHLVVLVVHEVVVMPVAVQVLQLVRVEDGTLDRIGRAEAVLDGAPGLQVAHLGLHHGAQVTGRVVMEFDHAVWVPVEEDDHTAADLRSGHRHGCSPSVSHVPSGGYGDPPEPLIIASDVGFVEYRARSGGVPGRRRNGDAGTRAKRGWASSSQGRLNGRSNRCFVPPVR